MKAEDYEGAKESVLSARGTKAESRLVGPGRDACERTRRVIGLHRKYA